ncbi:MULTISPECIES: hypothetical protein [Actinomadura]|jgi:hypothetical protein|uniref:Peptidase inhibitor family I36 n=1 Tax=Actinomadura citrea TaxID=46158 RepID=A0A7Y9KC45_9ACTN|nr:hypothetical protein [Actinomadura citrea]NYE10194.1 hypothetical protein [Actinomadura citrea]GGT70689.1 hypothetical protein GCM10010177_30320 [Actinomadura citrea]
MNRLMRALMVVPATAVLITAGTAAVASAATGTPSGAPPAEDDSSVWCVSTSGAKACFAEYGDRVWVKDTKANGASAAATLQDNESSASWYRECFNDRGADGGWVMCNFDVPEYQNGYLWAVDNPFVGSQAYTKIYTSGII